MGEIPALLDRPMAAGRRLPITLFSPTRLLAALLRVGVTGFTRGEREDGPCGPWADIRCRGLRRDTPSLLSGWGTWGARGVWGTARLRGRGVATRGPPGPCNISVPARIC